jgi:hypothetical protein
MATIGALLAVIMIAVAAPGSALGARPSLPPVFADSALWVRAVSPGQSGVELAQDAASAGVRTLYVKAGDGARPEAQFSPALVSELRSAGATVCAWTFMYGSSPKAEAASQPLPCSRARNA